ncbi:MAG: ATP-dependent Clp protease ATP-binding subunit [Defluviitaleaceae bacterium]|nr:ATP-dependent Clp protease ATP-binding subunit [Defluviitaleaceae bacterium]
MLELDNLTEQIYAMAVNEARLACHAHVTPEHFLYATLMFDVGRQVVGRGGMVSVPAIVADLDKYLKGYGFREQGENANPRESMELIEMIEIAVDTAQRNKKDMIELNDMLVAILYLPNNFAARVLLRNGLLPGTLYRAYADLHGDGESMGDDDICPCGCGMPIHKEEKPAVDYLEKYAINMVEKAKNGDYDPCIGREKMLDGIALLLCRKTKHNAVLTGDGGVGKTAVVQGLAMRIADGEVPEKLKNASIYQIDMGVMLAGTRFRGDFEDRLINTLEAIAEKGNSIVYVDDIHTMVGAGTSGNAPLDAGSIVKPFLSHGDLRFIGTTTFEDYKKHFEKSTSLTRRFQKIDVDEPATGEAIAILHGLADGFEKYHGVEYGNEALEAAVKLTAKYLHAARLPDKAIDAMDLAGAMVANANLDCESRYVGIDEIEKAIAQMAKIPETAISADERQSLATLKQRLESQVFGQTDAIDALVTAITTARLGLNDPEKPVASLLFVGPTGVGKTEIARTLAKQLNMPLTRFDMSEYQEQHAVSRLIGSPPGYVGHEEGGMLTDAINKTPATVLLLDEIEKAHPGILNTLLQVMDHGKLTDTLGRRADFRNVVLIMTSNAGAWDAARTFIGFESKKDGAAIKAQVDKVFSPEFRNRLTKVIQFNAVDEEMATKIARKAIVMLEARLAERGITITACDDAIDFIAKHGFSATYGAREIIRFVEGAVKEKIAAALLGGSGKDGIHITVKDGDIHIQM